jgi:hypothetical protein
MNPVSPWLAALAEQCLLFYLGRNSQDGIEVEDLEGCLSFSMRGLVMSAIIDKVRTQSISQSPLRLTYLVSISGGRETVIAQR